MDRIDVLSAVSGDGGSEIRIGVLSSYQNTWCKYMHECSGVATGIVGGGSKAHRVGSVHVAGLTRPFPTGSPGTVNTRRLVGAR